jgi:hypothetical protein
LSSSVNSGNQWYLDGAAISGATGATYTATAAGNYTVKASNGTCTSAISSAVSVTVNTTPNKPAITSRNATSFCAGGADTLVSNATSGNQWYLDGAAISGATNTTFVATANGNYTVITTNSSGCASAASAATAITVNSLPAKPGISWNGAQFSTSATGVSYQWLLSNNAVAGATAATYAPAAIGSYKVQITDNNGCKNTSDSFVLVVTAVNNAPSSTSDYAVKLMPNPATTEVTVQFNQTPKTELTIQIISSGGQLIKQVKTRFQTTRISLGNMIAGVYFVKITGTDYNQTQQLIISNH